MNERGRWAIRLTAAALLGLFAWWVSRPADDVFTSVEAEAFATHVRITYHGPADKAEVLRAVEAELQHIDALASTWRDDSELMRYNRAEDPESFDLSPELSDLIEQAKAIETQTGGAFTLRPDGSSIDLSGIAKGYAVDRVVELLQNEFGIKHCLVDIGGEVRALGNGPKGDGWRVGIYAPQAMPDSAAQQPQLELRDTSVATSGDYFKGDHIIDPATGKPVANDLISVSVIHPSNTTADALATAMYVMGHERGLAWAKDNTIHVIYLLKDGTQREHVPE